jgi:Tfp pilus assembly protein PilZ
VNRSEREHQRYAHEVAVTFRVGAKAFEGRTRNVSRGGLCATITDTLPAGTDVDLDIVLVFDDGMHSEALRLPGRVAWCTTVDEAHQLGISFRGLDKQRAEYLSMFLRYLDDQQSDQPEHEPSLDERFG